MRKRLKKKRRSCAMCKPHKTGASNRWKPKDAPVVILPGQPYYMLTAGGKNVEA